MPYVSDAQRKFFNANRARLTAQGVDVDEWNASSRGKKLPARKRPVQTTEKASQDTVRAQALTAILGDLAVEAIKPRGRTLLYTPLYGDTPNGLTKLCVDALIRATAQQERISSVLDETPCGSLYTEFPRPGQAKTASQGQNGAVAGDMAAEAGEPSAEACEPLAEACEPSLAKLAVDAVIRSFGGPLVHATAPVRTSVESTKLAAAAGSVGMPPLADSVGMLRNGGMANPLNVIQRGMTMPIKPPSSPSSNPINTYGPMNPSGTVGGGMFGQKMTETGSLKLSALQHIWQPVIEPTLGLHTGEKLSAWADRLVRLRRRRDPDGISTQPVDILLAQRTGE